MLTIDSELTFDMLPAAAQFVIEALIPTSSYVVPTQQVSALDVLRAVAVQWGLAHCTCALRAEAVQQHSRLIMSLHCCLCSWS